jgi:HEPN domain-containing protein
MSLLYPPTGSKPVKISLAASLFLQINMGRLYMMSPDEIIVIIVRDWTNKADQDIRSAEALLLQDPPLLFPSCFHSQQAAEKYLKAYLTHRQIEFPKTHSIRELLNLVGTVDDDITVKLHAAAELTPYGVDVRYPGDIPEPTRSETEDALVLARMVCEVVMRRLEKPM